jgi:hypothetical protein
MKKYFKKGAVLVLASISLGACSNDSKTNPQPTPTKQFVYDFEQDAQGWSGDFADYWIFNDRRSMLWSHRNLPNTLTPATKGLFIAANNESADLFMFFKKQVTGLKPATSYKIGAEITVATNYPLDIITIGGANAGAATHLKVAATATEPLTTLENNNWIGLNLNKGQTNSEAGTQSIVLGNVGISGEKAEYRRLKRTSTSNIVAKTNDKGELWVVVGFDSGYTGQIELYIDDITINVFE